MVTSMTLEFPLHNRFMCEGVEVWITHIGYPGKYNPAIKWRWQIHPNYLFVDIHMKVMFDKKYDLLHMNPGACGKSGFIKFAPCCAL
jgi:hypothetical protein